MKFEELGLAETLLRAVCAEGYPTPTKIQAAAIPPILAGRDVLGCAQNRHRQDGRVRPAHAAPLAGRAASTAAAARSARWCSRPRASWRCRSAKASSVYGRHTGLRHAVIYGGVGQHPQARALNAGVDILVATPGRLLDLMQQGFVDLVDVEVLDSGRGRPDARHGLSARPAADRRQGAHAAADAAVLGHDAARDSPSWPTQWLDEPGRRCKSTPGASTADTIEQSVVLRREAARSWHC